MCYTDRGVYLSYGLDFESGVSFRFNTESSVHIDFKIILNLFWSRVKSCAVTMSGKYQVVGSVLNTGFEVMSCTSLVAGLMIAFSG